MVDDIVFHLGDCKAGSTSIQLTLAYKAWEAKGVSVLYSTKINHIPLARSIYRPKEAKFQKERFNDLNKQLTESNAQYAVVSAEDFEFTDPVALRTAIHKHLPNFVDKIRLISYVRPHADKLVSAYAERVKKGNFFRTMDVMHDIFQKKERLYYAPRFLKWREVFGNQFTLHPMIREKLYKRDVVEDFFNYLLEGQPYSITNEVVANSSLSVEDLAMMRTIHRRIHKNNPNLSAQQQSFGWNYAPILAACATTEKTKLQLHKALAEEVAKVYRDDAEQLDAEFFEGTPMLDALNGAVVKAVDKPQSLLAKDYYKGRELKHIHAFSEMLQRLMEADPRNFIQAMRPPELRQDAVVKSQTGKIYHDRGFVRRWFYNGS